MKVSVLFVSLLVAIFLIEYSEAYISINIEPDDLEQVSDFLHMLMTDGNQILPAPITRTRMIVRMITRGLLKIAHYSGIMLTLVGATVISSHYIPDSNSKVILQNEQVSGEQKIKINPKILMHSEMCQIDYGCHAGVCWRSCHSNNHSQHFWCYTAPIPNARDLYRCKDASDCFLCWECVEPCHI